MNGKDPFIEWLEEKKESYYAREENCTHKDIRCVYKYDALAKFAQEVIEEYNKKKDMVFNSGSHRL
jgi:hypothetical protein